MNKIRLLTLIFSFLIANDCFSSSKENNLVGKESTISLLEKTNFITIQDSVKKSNGFLSRESIDKMIENLNQKIAAVQLEQKAADSKEKGLFGKLTQELGNNFREQKLSYFYDLKDLLENQREKLVNINQKVAKILD